ncbi:MAG TPA: nicotinate phosphoribosyltransferase [Oscillatoriaceae cyanobacterium]
MTYRTLPYNQSLALLTDFYQITMAYGYWKERVHDKEAVFNLYFRKNPFNGGYTIAAGLAQVLDALENFRFDPSDLAYLGGLTDSHGAPMFEQGFLDYLGEMKFSCDICAVPEGTVVFPNEPLLRVKGPLIQAQLLETLLLNLINFQTLIATKAARVCSAAQGQPVMEFGLRRAQGVDGGLSASRAAYIGGCESTSDVLAGKLFGIPVRGTHAHSWVMSFPTEVEAFKAYADALPDNAILLVDTYNTLQGVRHAVEVGHWLRERGHELTGVRLDSGDLAYLSIEARKILDAGGFENARIFASGDLNEYLIVSLKLQGARIDVWGVGTQLATAYDQPALGGVYKLTAIRDAGGPWQYKIKVSDNVAKSTTPGILQVRRYLTAQGFQEDMIFDEQMGVPDEPVIVDPVDMTRRKRISAGTLYEDLLVPVFEGGRRVYECPAIAEIRDRAQQQLAMLHPTIKRFENPHLYPAGLERKLFEFRTEEILKARGLPA